MLIKLKYLATVWCKNYNSMLSRFYLIPACDGWTDGRTDRQNCYINIVRQYAEAR